MTEITLEEFIKRTGMTPEEFEQAHPENVSVIKPQKARRYKKRKADEHGEISGTDTTVGPFGLNPALLDMIGIDYDKSKNVTVPDHPVATTVKNVLSGALQAPTDIPAFADLVRIGVPAVIEGVTSGDDSKLDAIGQAFMDRLLTEEDHKAIEQFQDQKVNEFLTSNPNASRQQVEAFTTDLINSSEFHEKVRDQLSWGIRIGVKGNALANKLTGVNKEPEQQTAGDDIAQAIGGVMVGIPASTASKIGNAATKMVGKKVAKNIATRILTRTAELATPGTFPFTPGNVAANSVVAGGLSEGIRYMQDVPTLLQYDEPVYDPERALPPETLTMGTGITLGAMFGLPGIRKVIRKTFDDEKKQGLPEDITKPKTLEEQSDRLKPQLLPTTGLVDENSPIKHLAQKFKRPEDMETIPYLDAKMSSISAAEAENNALNWGILPGVDDTIPYVEVERAALQLSPDEYRLFNDYVYAVQRMQDRNINMRNLEGQVRKAAIDYANATGGNDAKLIEETSSKLHDLQGELSELRRDVARSRSSLRHKDLKEIKETIARAEQNQKVKKIGDAYRKITTDTLDYSVANTYLSRKQANNLKSDRDLFVTLQQATAPESNKAVRKAIVWGKRLFSQASPDRSIEPIKFRRNVRGTYKEKHSHVDYPMDALVALKRTIVSTVRSVSINKARLDVIDTLRGLPGAEGTVLRKSEKGPKNKRDRKRFVRVQRSGKEEWWEFGDATAAKALQFAPGSAIPILNETRKLKQFTLTGLGAPWFATKTFLWDVPYSTIARPDNRSFGIIDTFARMLINKHLDNTIVGDAVDTLRNMIPDPTSLVSTTGAIPYSLGMRGARALGTKIASDLEHSSGIFNAIAKLPQGRELLEWTGTVMAQTFDNSVYSVMTKNLSTSLSHLNDTMKILDDYDAEINRHTGIARRTFNTYKAVLESIQMASRTAFFFENYVVLKHKYNGNVPQAEIDKLRQDTRNLTGDMSRKSVRTSVQYATSTTPYSNTILQGTRHFLGLTIPSPVAKGINKLGGNMLTDRNDFFWPRIAMGIILPKIGALTVMSQWQGAEDWWYNNVPAWQQHSSIPLPNAKAISYYMENGKWPDFNPDHVDLVPTTPEFTMIVEPVIAGLRALGVIGKPSSKEFTFQDELREAMSQVTSFMTPPLIEGSAALGNKRVDLHAAFTGDDVIRDIPGQPFAGTQRDRMTIDSDISNAAYHAIIALLGASGQMAMQSLNVGMISYKNDKNLAEAFADAIDVGTFEAKRRFPKIDVPPLYDAVERNYAFTPESKYVNDTLQDLDKIIGRNAQMNVEIDSKGNREAVAAVGIPPPPKISNPLLSATAQFIWDKLRKKGTFKEAQEQYSTLRKIIANNEGFRYKGTQEGYNKTRNELIERQQKLKSIQARELRTVEDQLKKRLNRQFMQQFGVPFSYKNFAELVEKDIDAQ